ncbi:hypothetical protein DN752_01700 [Echinicola strongylocentroti]|uniref:Uncharacterized protein n=1 Tax=Echinicola strongylocentroti TaxID=1795355 RepID=A0A2Z4IE56_9BACT|nr:hypothetical protein [Echinicola strongylocentroti]AWW28947.1 hypothetical protein DN752_01700 [Echinicola strongylocentroti]
MLYKNDGFKPETIKALKEELRASGKAYKVIPSDGNNDEFVNFYFIGMFEGREVIYDAALYTLRLHHSSEIYELAEHKAAQKFPDFKGIHYEEDENGNLKPLDNDEEEIGWFITEIIMDLEEEEAVKVQEFIDIDTNHDFGMGVDVALHVDHIDDTVISKFIKEFNDDTIKLDDTMYSFQSEDIEE